MSDDRYLLYGKYGKCRRFDELDLNIYRMHYETGISKRIELVVISNDFSKLISRYGAKEINFPIKDNSMFKKEIKELRNITKKNNFKERYSEENKIF